MPRVIRTIKVKGYHMRRLRRKIKRVHIKAHARAPAAPHAVRPHVRRLRRWRRR